MNFLLIVGSSRLEDLGPFQKRACNHNMRLPGDACQGAIFGPKAGWTSSPDPSSRWGYEASLKTGFHFTCRPLGCTGEAYYLSTPLTGLANRSEERRVGKECRSRWSPYA